jgi:hypothetical protein
MARVVPVAVLAAALGLLAAPALAGCAGPAPVTAPPPPGYAQRLATTDHDISAALDTVDTTNDPAALARAVLDAAGVVSASSQRLATGGPVPPSVAAANDALSGTLSRFAGELAYLAQQINQQVICTGSTADNAITTAPSMAALREEATRLAEPPPGVPAFHWGAWLPAPRDQMDARMPSGRIVVDRRPGAPGNGVLKLTDDGDTDALLTLAQNGRTVVEIAVRSGESTQLGGIPDGQYDVYYRTGTDWDDVAHDFGRQCQFHRFTAPSTFTSHPVPGGTAYTVQSITVSTTDAPDGQDDPGVSAVQPDGLPR